MILLREPNTNVIIECQNEAAIANSMVNYPRLTQEEFDAYYLQKAKDAKISLCKAYLLSTDWQSIRKSETGESMKTGIEANRALARSLQDNINNCTTIEEVDAVDITF